jgi:hypothetical protein
MPPIAELTQILIALAPALFLVAALLLGRFPGERAIERLAAAAAKPARPRAPASMPAPRRAPRALVRASELLARHLAVRPPPAFSLT